MKSKAKLLPPIILTLLGVAILVSSMANPPIPKGGFENQIIIQSDSGVHLNDDLTVDYHKKQTNHVFQHAYIVFFSLVTSGFALVIYSIKYAINLSSAPKPGNDSGKLSGPN